MSALGRVVRAGVGRRRVRTAVIILTTLMAVTASVLAAGLLVAAQAPFDRAFAKQRGAHLTAQFDGTKATASKLAATAHASGVTAAVGPFRTHSVRPRTASRSDMLPAGVDLPPLTVVGRADAAGRVDGLTVVAGTWATRPGQIVVAYDRPVQPGQRLTFPSAPGSPTLTVVGVARSVTGSADAWVTPAQAEALTAPGGPLTYEMLYRFRHADTDAQMAANRAAVTTAVPRGTMTGSHSYLAVKQQETANAMAFVPFLAAFGVLGLLLSVLVIGIVVSGAVGAATRRIGILKSLGFTPAQVVRAYVGQALIPAAVGCALGLALGNLLAIPVLREIGTAFGGPAASIPVWIDAVVSTAALVLVAGSALVPASRAGRLRPVEAISVGRIPDAGRGRLVRRLTGRLPLPRAVSLGLANPFVRPTRSATTAAAVAFGAATVTFGVGLALTLGAVQSGRMLDSAGSVVVETGGGQAPPGAQVVHAGGEPDAPKADLAEIATALRAQQGTRRFYGTAQAEVSASGITGATTVVAYQGDASWAAPQMVAGSWLDGPGQAVVTPRFLRAGGIRVGDTVTLTAQGRRTSVRIVGEAFFTQGEGMELLTPTSTLAVLGLDAKPGRYHVETRPGTALAHYLTSLNTALEPVGAVARANTANTSDVIVTMDALVGTLTLMLVAVAGLGVLNTVVLETRDRVHELGVFKALGMAPRQTVTMVLTSVGGIGLVAGAAGVPAGVALHRFVTPLMGNAIGMALPTSVVAVFPAPLLAVLALGGLVIAVTGALLPAGWAARQDTATALRSE
ncbi:FtsX-like permease family protein [Streptomyces sp. WAC07094]|uniref:FtsX-like permease family protein n=1 Tax=Streptomyces sp. WAC07094 TaxID=3072183 RepID=UPI002EB23C54|nr:FtsX-like permease family protein [Streptomyces sp. WAC07094]